MALLVRPIGPWRFLTPLESVESGDLGRLIESAEVKNSMWSPIDENDEWGIYGLGDPVQVVGHPVYRAQGWEFIRPLEGGSYVHYIKEGS